MSVKPILLFAPGAGAPSTSPWMRSWAERLASLGAVVALDYPYMKQGRKAPDKLPVLVAAHRAALREAIAAHPRAPVVLIGKSMGSRVGCHLAAAPADGDPPIAGLVCLGYPLRSPSGQLRDEVLRALARPILFAQGTRDALCPLDALATVRARMSAPSELIVVEGGDHSLVLSAAARKAQGITQEQSDARVLAAIAHFLNSSCGIPASH
jgi:predicted alpha/beta-hydrolase family hydrolase